ncbi:MAG: ribosomal protein S18-alanine N-acetyltransferase [Candidatus Thermoplasmatota archaeon]|nr:ribosomal protein S18-alanine N-acetyltransferase [Candidatus Thermoplasmatota archaeon]
MLRKASVKDLEAIYRVEESCFDENERYPKELIRYFLAIEATLTLVEERNNTILGYITISVNRNTARIISIAVLPQFRMKGIGSRLLEEAERIAKELKVKRFILEVGVDNKGAIKFYLSHNYKIDFVIPNYYPDQNAYRMSKSCTEI